MSDRGLLNRMERLEGRLDVGNTLSHLTLDELQIRMLDVCQGMLADNAADPDFDRAHVADLINEIETGIRAQAAMRRQPDYARHLAWVQGKRPIYVPAVCGRDGKANGMNEYADLFRPNIMERRAAIFARPDVQALIDECIA